MPENMKKPQSAQEGYKSKKIWLYLPLLLVFVSVTSFIAGTRIGRGTDLNLGQMLDTIVLTPTGEIVDENHIDFSGQLWNADGSPCANQILELHSDPMRTVTDSEGVFYFRNAEVGEHRLAMLDDSGRETGTVAVKIGRNKEVSYGNVEEGTAGEYHLNVSEQAVVLHIKMHVDGENHIVLEPEVYTRRPGEGYRDSSGREQFSGTFEPKESGADIPESGEGLLDQENLNEGQNESEASGAAAETEAENASKGESQDGTQDRPSRESPNPAELEPSRESETETPTGSQTTEPAPTEPSSETTDETKQPSGGGSGGGGDSSHTNPTKPQPTVPTEPSEPGTEPTNPTEPTKPTNPTEPTSPTDPTTPTDPATKAVTVQEKSGPVWTQNTVISLFANRTGTVGCERKLLPGSSGYYEFLVSNPNNFGITYRMSITAPPGQMALPLNYRLRSGDTYLCGDKNTWLTSGQLSAASVKLEPGDEKEYRLEWQWPYEGGDDEYDTMIGRSDNLEYRVIVTIAIEQTM